MWKSKLKLEKDERIRLDKKCESGHLGQEEVELYSVINFCDEVVGSVRYTDHTSTKAPFRRILHVVQKERSGQVLVDATWSE
jgi:hypothetical protein